MCYDFYKENCKNGVNCKLSHDYEIPNDKRASSKRPLDSIITNNLPKMSKPKLQKITHASDTGSGAIVNGHPSDIPEIPA